MACRFVWPSKEKTTRKKSLERNDTSKKRIYQPTKYKNSLHAFTPILKRKNAGILQRAVSTHKSGVKHVAKDCFYPLFMDAYFLSGVHESIDPLQKQVASLIAR